MTSNIDNFINKMKSRDMRIPAKKDFDPSAIPTDIEALTQKLTADRMPLDFWYDTAVSTTSLTCLTQIDGVL
jgi:hypothetical protein